MAYGVISVSSRLAGNSSESFRPSLLTVTGLNSLFSNHLSGTGSWLLMASNVSSTEVCTAFPCQGVPRLRYF